MSYVVVGDRFINSEEILIEIMNEFEFKEVRDLTRSAKREDTLVYQIIQEESALISQIDFETEMETLPKEEFVEELMAIADENLVFIEDILPEGFLCYGYSYYYDEDLREIKSIFVAIDEAAGEKKLKDVVNRILKSID